MKLKQSCYDPAFCRMGFRRFAPLGILYTLVLMLLTLVSVNLGSNQYGNITTSMSSFSQITILLQLGYAFVLAQLLLGDLYTPRLCYAIHALPVTRGGWFGTQVILGSLSVIPGILISGGMMLASMTRFRILIPVWMGSALLEFLFFFGAALLCGVCAGNRAGMTLLYGLVNFFGVVATWAYVKIICPLIFGMYIPVIRARFCPLTEMMGSYAFRAIYSDLPSERYLEDGPTVFFECPDVTHIEFEPKAIWTLVFFAVLGCAAIWLAMKLLNRRKPECAGDLLAFRKMEPVILVLCTLSAGVVAHAVSSEFDWNIGYLMLAVGLAVGYYCCLMLLKRQVNVFSARSLLPLGAMGIAVVLVMAAAGLNLFGNAYRVPEADKIEKAELRNPSANYRANFTASSAEDIEKILTLHRDALEEHRVMEANRPLLERIFGNEEKYLEYEKDDGTKEASGQMFITYTLKNGSEVSRSYQYHETSPHLDILQELYSRPEFVFSSYDTKVSTESELEALLEKTELIRLICWHESDLESGYYYDGKDTSIPREAWDGLLDAMLKDCEEGNMAQSWSLHPDAEDEDHISFIYPAREYKGMYPLEILLFSDCQHTIDYLVSHGYHEPLESAETPIE